MADERITKVLASNLDLLVEQKVRECLESSGVVESSYNHMTPGEAAEMAGCNKSIILDLIKNRRSNNFPGTQLSPKVFTINRNAFIDWLNSGGILAEAKNKDKGLPQ